MLRVILPTIAFPLLLLQQGSVDAFMSTQSRVPLLSRQQGPRVTQVLGSSTVSSATAEGDAKPKHVKELGLLTFDLDDTLYPISAVVASANRAFVDAMARYGYEGLSPIDIVTTGKQIRSEISHEDPDRAKALSHTEIRELAIRREIEKIILERKLQACADDWATQVSSLSPIVVDNAKRWAKTAVSESQVQAVLNAWEMERHHSAERHLFPEVVEALKRIKEEHPGVVIGAVTDGRANPLLMTFTLAPYFDFCMSWEDDQAGRTQFFQELDGVDGRADLTWIYDAARHKYAIFKETKDAMNPKFGVGESRIKPLVFPDTYDDLVWIHVGDDLAFDVGGSSACGAKTVLVELPPSSGQSARFRFDAEKDQPDWSTTSAEELELRVRMNEAAKDYVDESINTIERLPIAINDIIDRV